MEWSKFKRLTTPSVGKVMEQLALSRNIVGNKNWYNHFRKLTGRGFLKLNIYLLCDPTVPFLDTYLREVKT